MATPGLGRGFVRKAHGRPGQGFVRMAHARAGMAPHPASQPGARFSRNAAMPSRASPVAQRAKASAPASA